MDDRIPTIRSRELGDGLRLAMEQAQLNGKRLADLLDWSESRVSRLLTGRRGGTEVEVAQILAVCGITGREREHLLSLCKDQNTRSWFQQFGSRLPLQIRTYTEHENKATRIIDFTALVIPGILQTSEYARALFTSSGTVPEEEIEQRVATRAARQVIFSRYTPAQFNFLIHELVLRLPVGGDNVMAEQLHYLLRMSVRPYIKIRVIPARAGAHAGSAGSFVLLESQEFRSMVYLEGETSGVFLEKPEEVAAYRNVLKGLTKVALEEEESKEVIASLATDLYGGRRDYHDRG